jgi:hypothetical protein
MRLKGRRFSFRAVRSLFGRQSEAIHMSEKSPLLISDRFRPKPVVAVKRRYRKLGPAPNSGLCSPGLVVALRVRGQGPTGLEEK